ncbi:MAG: leucine-rich repeat domain-containing protein [Clostridia bacterium]|nr:leucine-rich repeat domain-containing protein [Clostridia bacterium]
MSKTKKLLTIILAVLMIATTIPVAFAADIVESGNCGTNVTWTLDDKGTFTVKGSGNMTAFARQSDVPWYSTYRTSIKNVVIEDGVTSIGNYSFMNCSNLISVSIGKDVKSIGKYAFCACHKLESVSFPAGLMSIGDWAFNNCHKITSVTIPEGVTTTGNYTFSSCYALESVTLPASLTTIGTAAFQSCKLKDVVIPDNVKNIYSYSFSLCKSLETVTIPKSVTSIGKSAFSSCESLENVNYLGTADDWAKISVADYNAPLTVATSHYCEAREAVAATCTTDGNEAGLYCTDCEEYVEGGKVIAASHTYSGWIEAIAPDCEKDGTLGHYSCEVCGVCFDAEYEELDSIVISATGHPDKNNDGICDDCDICEYCEIVHTNIFHNIFCKIRRFFVLLANFLAVVDK